MREILFRGKDIAGNWHYGVPLVFTEDYVCITAPHTYNKAVIPETVGQFTGLTDEDGKKIFEGDIVQNGTYMAVVKAEVFNCGCCHCVYGFSTDDDDVNIGEYCKVVGNIHDNPELLK